MTTSTLSKAALLREVKHRLNDGSVSLDEIISTSFQSTDDDDDDDTDVFAEVDVDDIADVVCDAIVDSALPIVSFSLTRDDRSHSADITALLFIESTTLLAAPPASQEVSSMITLHFALMTVDLPMPRHLPIDFTPRPALSKDDANRIRPLTNDAFLRFQRHSNVIAVTAGYARLNSGEWSDEPHWIIFVHHKDFVPWGERPLPRRFKHIPITVCEGRYDTIPSVSRFDTVNPSGVYRYIDPLQPGVSIGMDAVPGGGTLGGFVIEEKGEHDGAVFGLTNAHVLRSRENAHNGDPRYEVRRITQPAPSDAIRTHVTLLEAQQTQLNLLRPRPSDYQLQLNNIKSELTRMKSPDYQLSRQDTEDVVIGKVSPDLCFLGEYRMRLDNPRQRPAIGIDAAVFRYEGTRMISLNMEQIELKGRKLFTPSVSLNNNQTADVPDRELSFTSHVLEWTYEANESEDVVIKIGRTTGVTCGAPISAPSAVNTRQVGTYEIVRSGDRNDVVHYRKRSSNDLWLRNQYFVGHASGHPFVDVGDSGSVCYLNSPNWDQESRWKLRPWGLLHARVVSESYSFAVLSPIDAVLRCFNGRSFLLLGHDNEHLLNALQYKDET